MTMQGVVIGLEETSYTTPESETVEVCASLLQGQLERNAEVVLSTQDEEAIGLLYIYSSYFKWLEVSIQYYYRWRGLCLNYCDPDIQ